MNKTFRIGAILSALILVSISNASVAPASGSAVKAHQIRIPSDVLGLKKIGLSKDGIRLTLSWEPNPSSEKVDKYAVFALHEDPITSDGHPAGYFLGESKTGTLVAKLTTNPTYVRGGPFTTPQGKGSGSYFWVVAHNAYGWGVNDYATPNLDKEIQLPVNNTNRRYPKILYLEFPCSAQGKRDHIC